MDFQKSLWVLGCFFFAHITQANPKTPFLIHAETSSFQETGSFGELDAWASDLKKKHSRLFHSSDFGVTPDGRRMRSYIIGESSKPVPHRPVILVVAGIHAGEIDGKDAGMIFFRDFLQSKEGSAVLKKLSFVFVPIFNVDGFARFGTDHRPNQNGPIKTGWRVTSQNLNLNRDFMKARAPEMRALLKLVETWDPLITTDLHVTDGADFQYDVGIVIQPRREDSLLAPAGQELTHTIVSELTAAQFKGLPFYPSFKEESPASGIEDDWSPPRFSQGYFSSRNRIGILVETHSWKPYGRRVKTMIQILKTLAQLAPQKADGWTTDTKKEDGRTWTETPMTLSYGITPESISFDFDGYESKRVISPISGKTETEYNPGVKQIWKIPLQLKIKPELQMTAPKVGYVIPAAQAALVQEFLLIHGIPFQKIDKEILSAELEAFRVSEFELSAKSFEGMQTAKVQGTWTSEKIDLPPGSLWIPALPPKTRLTMSLLEPLAPDSLVSWGFMNAFLERREYMEGYVAHQVGLQMLEKNEAVSEEFKTKIHADNKFAEDSEARLDFFYQKHPSFDKIWKRLPIFRAQIPLGKKSVPL